MISILCPTRNRVDRLFDMIRSAVATAKAFHIEFVFYIDHDDKLSVPTLERLKEDGHDVKWVVGDRIKLSDTYNYLLPLSTGKILMCGGDDILFRTNGWPEVVLNAFEEYEDGILLCGGDDLLNNDLLTHPFLPRKYAELIGRISAPYFAADYLDTWYFSVFSMIDRVKKLPIIIEHMHFSNGKAEIDTTMKEKLERTGLPGLIYQATEQERVAEAVKLKKYIEEFYNV